MECECLDVVGVWFVCENKLNWKFVVVLLEVIGKISVFLNFCMNFDCRKGIYIGSNFGES